MEFRLTCTQIYAILFLAWFSYKTCDNNQYQLQGNEYVKKIKFLQ